MFEKLAEQLREPLFRSDESGYDPLDVRAFLDEAAARLAVLEARVAKAEARAEKAERRLESAWRFVKSGGVVLDADTGVLDDVVMAGQHRAEQIVADAEAEVIRLRQEAVQRVAESTQAIDDPRLRTELDEQRQSLRSQLETCHVAQADLETVDRAVQSARRDLLSELERELAELASMPFLLAKEARS